MRIATLVCLSFAVSFGALTFALPAAECDSAVQITEKNSQLVIKNISGEPIVAYVLTSHSKNRDGSATRTYSGTFSGEDSLAAGQSMELGEADSASKELSVKYVRLANDWRCGEAPPEASTTESTEK